MPTTSQTRATSRLILLALLVTLSLHTGCTAGKQVQRGIHHAVCLFTADVDCIRNMYNQDSNASGVQTEGPSAETKQNIEKGLKQPEIITGPVTRGSETVIGIKVKNRADVIEGAHEGITAKNVLLEFGLYKTFKVKKIKRFVIDRRSEQDQQRVEQLENNDYSCSKEKQEGNYSHIKCQQQFEIPVKWEKEERLPPLQPGDPWQEKYYLDTSRLEPTKTEAYQRICGGYNCTVLTQPPYSFRLNGTIAYGFRTSAVLPYRVYNKDYWRTHQEQVEKELTNYCNGGRQTLNQARTSKTPIRLNGYVLGCELFAGDDVKIFLRATTKHNNDQFTLRKINGQDPIESQKENCERQTMGWTYQGGKQARWQCSRKLPEVTPEGSTLTFAFKLPYRLTKTFEQGQGVRILPRN